MPKALDRKLIDAIKKAYLGRKSRPTLKELATEFSVGLSTLKIISAEEKWAELRKTAQVAQELGAVQGAKSATRQRSKLDDLVLLNEGIADLSAEIAAIEAKSKEGCATAMANLIKVKRELFPPTAEDLAEMAVNLGITPSDFLTALQRRWAKQELQPQQAE